MTFRATSKWFGPRWLVDDGEESTRIQYSHDLMLDAVLERTQLGQLAKYPDTAALLGIEGALEAIGRDRRTVRGIGESATSYATRLKAWLPDAKKRGSPFALLKKLQEYIGAGSSMRTVDARGNWFSRSAAGGESYLLNQGNWNWDSAVPASPEWARFWVIIYPGTRWIQGPAWGAVGGPTWGTNEFSWGSTATDEEVERVRSIILNWKPAGTRCQTIIVAFDAASFAPTNPLGTPGMPDGTWSRGSALVGGINTPTRLSTAIYWDGT